MADTTNRSADFLATDVAHKITNDADFRTKVADDPSAAAAQIQTLAGTAKAKSDAVGSGEVTKLNADTARAAASADKIVYVIAVTALGLVSCGVVVTIFLLAYPQIKALSAVFDAAHGDMKLLGGTRIAFSIPDGLIALGSAAIGALAGLLGPLGQRR